MTPSLYRTASTGNTALIPVNVPNRIQKTESETAFGFFVIGNKLGLLLYHDLFHFISSLYEINTACETL